MATFYGIGLILTFLLGVFNAFYNYRNSKKTSFINTVTAERVKWLQNVRENISNFCSLTLNWSEETDTDKKLSQELDKLIYLIQLQLNPDGETDKEIVSLINETKKQLYPRQNIANQIKARKELNRILEKLVEVSQRMLKEEWDKVKDESKKGDLKDKSWFDKFKECYCNHCCKKN